MFLFFVYSKNEPLDVLKPHIDAKSILMYIETLIAEWEFKDRKNNFRTFL